MTIIEAIQKTLVESKKHLEDISILLTSTNKQAKSNQVPISPIKNLIFESAENVTNDGDITNPIALGINPFIDLANSMKESVKYGFNFSLYGTDSETESVDFSKKTIYRKFGSYQFTGEESIGETYYRNSVGTVIRMHNKLSLPVNCVGGNNINIVGCSHYIGVVAPNSIAEQTTDKSISIKYDGIYNDIRVLDSRFNTSAEFLQYCKEQYALGTPITFVYKVEPYKQTISNDNLSIFNAIRTHAGENAITSNCDFSIELWKNFFCKEYVDSVCGGSGSTIDKDILGFVTPEMFGGVGDEVNDDTKAIQDCIDYASENDYFAIMGKKYLTTSPIILTNNHDGLKLSINKIKYLGSDEAICLTDLVCNVNIDIQKIQSNGHGITVRYNSPKGIMRDHSINIGNIVALKNAINIEAVGNVDVGGAYSGYHYNNWYFKSLSAGDEYACISILHNQTSGTLYHEENRYYGGKCDSGAWAVYGDLNKEQFYGFVCESNIGGGVYALTGACLLDSWRVVELMDRYHRPLVKSDRDSDFDFNNINVSTDYLDFTNASSVKKTWAKKDIGNAFVHYSMTDFVPKGDSDVSQSVPIGNTILINGGEPIVIPNVRQSADIIVPEFYVGVVDKTKLTSDNFGIKKYKHAECFLYQRFVIKNTTVIHLNSSYTPYGIDSIEIVQDTAGATARVIDAKGNLIFDGTNLGLGRYELKLYETGYLISTDDDTHDLGYIWEVNRIS